MLGSFHRIQANLNKEKSMDGKYSELFGIYHVTKILFQ
ncbi:MAG: hypothetical protein UU89_C0008G0016, partial [Parcubacteria group bacterium GW2011_GWC2_42_11]